MLSICKNYDQLLMHIISLHFYVTLWFKFNFTLHTSIMNTCLVQFTSFHFSQSVLSNSLWPHELQHARPPCATPTSRAYPNSCPLSWWCHPTISSSVIPFSSCPQSLSASGSFPVSQLFAWGGQSIGVSNIYVNIIRSTSGIYMFGNNSNSKGGSRSV